MGLPVTQFVLFLLLFARVSAVVVVAPVFGHTAVPVQVKVGLSLFLSLVLYPLLAQTAPALDLRLLPLLLLAIKEALVGLLLGFATLMVFAGARAAGELISYELGLSVSFVADPETGQATVLAQFFYLLLLLVFLLINGHHFVLEAIRYSYATVPVGGFAVTAGVADKVVALTGMVFIVAVKIAAPVMVASFLVNLAMSILSKVAPQINVFLLSFPLKIAVGSFVLMTTIPVVVYVFKKLLGGFEADLMELVRLF